MEYEINQFCVAEAFLRQGVGSYFLLRIEEAAGKCGMNAVVLNTNRGFPAEKFYRKNGYRILEESVVLAKQIPSPEKTDSVDRRKRKTCVRVKPRTIVMDCPDAASLAEFYSKLLGWTISVRQPDWVLMRNPDGGTGFFLSERTGVHAASLAGRFRRTAKDAACGFCRGEPAAGCRPCADLRGCTGSAAVFGGRHGLF